MTTTNPASPSGPVSLKRILLIDDDPISREVLAMMLEMHGIAIDTAEDGEAALAMLDAAQLTIEPDQGGLIPNPLVILMDAQMPGLSGVALVQALRSRCQGRIIAISGSEVSQEIRQATDGFLMKPVEVETLVGLLEASVAGHGNAALPSIQSDIHASALEETAQQASLDVLDPLILGKFRAMMSAQSVREIYVAVADDLKPRLGQLESAMQSGEHAEVRRIAHAIKGGCAMVGLTPAANASARLETSNGPETYASELQQLLATHKALEVILKDDFAG